MEVVALWVNRKPKREFDLQMTGSQEVLFWYERTIISLQFFINLILRKYFRIQASMNTGNASANEELVAVSGCVHTWAFFSEKYLN